MRATVPGCRFPIAVERPWAGYSDAAADVDQSFVSGDGAAWTDMTSVIAGTYVCLKGYGSPGATGLGSESRLERHPDA